MEQDQERPREIAFVLYPGLTPLDVFGPLQVFTVLGLLRPEFRAVAVAKTTDPIDTDGPIRLVADRTFPEVPDPYALIVPGGAAPTMRALGDEVLLAYVRQASLRAEVVGSVCTGSLILAAAGLLVGRRATTHWSFAKQLGRLGADYRPDRWVEDGRFITSAGISAGIDMALHLAGELAGKEVERQIQLVLEYDPQPPLGGIDWDAVDRDMLDPLVHQWIEEGLGHMPELVAKLG